MKLFAYGMRDSFITALRWGCLGLVLALCGCAEVHPTRILTVNSTDPSSGVPITGTKTSITTSGTTPYHVDAGASGVTLTAPELAPNGNVFLNWSGCKSTGGKLGTDCSVDLTSAGQTVTANYAVLQPPTLVRIAPGVSFADQLALQVTLTGTNFTSTATVNVTTLAGAPAPITVTAGSISLTSRTEIKANFAIPANTPSGPYQVTVTTASGSASSTGFVINAPVIALFVQALDFIPNALAGGQSSVGTVTMNAPVPAGGFMVDLTSSNPAVVTVPATVNIPAGASSATFTATTSVVTAATPVDVTAHVGAAPGITTTLTLNAIPTSPPKIAFNSTRNLDGVTDGTNANSTSNIWLMNADGTSQTPLTTLTAARAGSIGPVWSPDGTKILFVSGRSLTASQDAANGVNAIQNIWVMNADGSNQKALTTLTTTASSSAVWSPDGTKIAFASLRALDGSDSSTINTNLWIMDADGFNQAPLTHYTFAGAPTSAVVSGPVWSPVRIGGQYQVAFNSRANVDGTNTAGAFNSNVWRINEDGTGLQALTQLANVNCLGSAWSPDGTKIGFASPRALDGSDSVNNNSGPSGTSNVWIINANGTGTATALTALRAAGASSSSPVWSPDGTKILFGSSRSLTPTSDAANTNAIQNVWVMNADGANPTPLTRYTFSGGFSTAVAFATGFSPGKVGGKFQIAYMSYGNLDGSDSANANDAFNIWLMNDDGTSRTPLTRFTVPSSTNPSWLR